MIENQAHLTPQIHLRSYSSIGDTHSHHFGQWVFPLAGTLNMEIDGSGGQVEKMQSAFIAEGKHHSFEACGDNLFLVLDIKNSTLFNEITPAFWQIPDSLHHYLKFAKHYLHENNNVESQILINDFMLKLLNQHFLSQCDPKVLIACRWIENNFAKAIDLKQVASKCCLSISQLQRRFKLVQGIGLAEYWRKIRIEQAQILLRHHPKMLIETIAMQVGYENLTCFSRSFHHLVGISPSEWRK